MNVYALLVLAFAPVVAATKGFTFNDDMVCGYPFEGLVIESISCAPSTFLHALPEGKEPANIYDSHDVCAFGNQMDIVGTVPVTQAISRYYNANLNACFRTGEYSWYNTKKCMLFKTSIDLRAYVDEADEEEAANAEALAAQKARAAYIEPGQITFTARLIIPKRTFTFKPDYIVSAELALVPGSYSVDGDTYKFTSVCTATFNAIFDESEQRYSTKYAAASVLAAVGLLFSAYCAGGKVRRICTASSMDGSQDDDAMTKDNNHDFIEMNKIDEDAETSILSSDPSQISSLPIDERSIATKDSRRQTSNNNSNKKFFPTIFRNNNTRKKAANGREISIISTADADVEIRDYSVAI